MSPFSIPAPTVLFLNALLFPQAPSSVRDQSRVVLNDGSCWTIIGVEAVEYTFNQGLSRIQTPVTPFPVITGLEVGINLLKRFHHLTQRTKRTQSIRIHISFVPLTSQKHHCCCCCCCLLLQVNGGGHVAMLEIQGENFSPHLKVWFGNNEAETMLK